MKKIILIIVFIVCYCCKKVDDPFSVLRGELLLSTYYYQGDCLSCDSVYTLYIDTSGGWVRLEDRKHHIISDGKCKLYFGKEKQAFFDIFGSKDEHFNGNYKIDIDTIYNSSQRLELRITIQSHDTYIQASKNIIKTIGV